MPSSAVHTYTDPDDYAASVRGTNAEVTITERGLFSAKFLYIDLHHLSMQRLSDNLARIAHAADFAGQATISFCTRAGPSLLRNGIAMLPSNIIRRADAESYFQQSNGLACFGNLSLPVEEMASVGEALVGCDLTPPKDALTITPPRAAMARLQRLHEVVGQLAEDAPEIIACLEAARGLEQALIESMVGCLGPGKVGEDRAALRQHAMIMRRFHRMVGDKPDQAIFVPELCRAIALSERTLRICCQEQLGVSPKQYLLLRRLHLMRRGLLESGPTATTVTEIATRYGFWQFGRLAGEYRSLFGELPSTTLARPHG